MDWVPNVRVPGWFGSVAPTISGFDLLLVPVETTPAIADRTLTMAAEGQDPETTASGEHARCARDGGGRDGPANRQHVKSDATAPKNSAWVSQHRVGEDGGGPAGAADAIRGPEHRPWRRDRSRACSRVRLACQ